MITFPHHVRGLFCVTAVPPSLGRLSRRAALRPLSCWGGLPPTAALGHGVWGRDPLVRASAQERVVWKVEHEGPTVRWSLIVL